jgi:hypothetical protein
MIFQITNSGGNYRDETKFENVVLVTINFESIINKLNFYKNRGLNGTYIYVNIWNDDKIVNGYEIDNTEIIDSIIEKLKKHHLYNKINSFFQNKIDTPSFENSNYGDLLIIADYFKIK